MGDGSRMTEHTHPYIINMIERYRRLKSDADDLKAEMDKLKAEEDTGLKDREDADAVLVWQAAANNDIGHWDEAEHDADEGERNKGQHSPSSEEEQD